MGIINNYTTSNGSRLTDEEIFSYLKQLDYERINGLFLPAIIFLVILAIVGIIGNTLVLIIYIKYFKHNPSRVFILAVAAFDLVNNILCIPGEIVDLSLSFTFSNAILCKFFRFNTFFATVASILILVFISVERHRKVCRPLKKQMNERMAYKAVFVVVIVTALTSFPAIILSGTRTKATKLPGIFGHDCTFKDSFQDSIYPKLFLATQFLLFIVCTVVLIVLYSLIGMGIYRHKPRRNTMQISDLRLNEMSTESTECETNNFTERKTSRTSNDTNVFSVVLTKFNNKKVSKDTNSEIETKRRIRVSTVKRFKTTLMLLTITVAFIVSYLPYLIISFIKVFTEDFENTLTNTTYIVYTLFLRSYFLNSAFNPIIYSLWNKEFRVNVMNLFRRTNTN